MCKLNCPFVVPSWHNTLFLYITDEVPESYWRDLAEERRLSLAEALSENETVSMQGVHFRMVLVVNLDLVIPPVDEVYRGYIVFAFSVRMFVCVSVNFFSVKDFSETT